jgi:phosphatidylglycerophosphatase A
MKLEIMKSIPRTRSEFERNIHILAELLREGRMKFASHLEGTLNGLSRVRGLPNGRINFLTINESARLIVNMAAEMGEKDIPISQMQQTQSQGTEDAEISQPAKDTIGSDDEGNFGESPKE